MLAQIRSVHQARRAGLEQKVQDLIRTKQGELVALQSELRFAELHCPNRIVRIRELMQDCEAAVASAPETLMAFDRDCAPYLERFRDAASLDPFEVERFYGVMGVMYNPTFKTPTSTLVASGSAAMDSFICPRCDENRVFDEYVAFAVCPKCGHSVPYQKESHDMEDKLQTTVQFEYERQTHLREYINQIVKAEENAGSVPIEIIRGIKRQILKERITDRSVITPRRINNWLKHDLDRSKFAEKKWSILYTVCKVRPPKIPAALVDKFFEMFAKVEKAFARHVPPGRVHFFNYGYILRKFSESLDQRHLLSVFTILKGTDRVHFQDDIWKKCCADIGWKFIPSI